MHLYSQRQVLYNNSSKVATDWQVMDSRKYIRKIMYTVIAYFL